MKQSYLVPEEFQGERIDKYLSEACCGLTRSYLQKLLKSQLVEVDGKAVKNSYRVSAGETVELEVPEAVEPEIEAEPIPLDILY